MNVTNLPARMQSKIAIDENRCWNWLGAKNSRGYGQVSVAGVSKSIHRTTYAMLVGPIPDGLQIDHLCRNKSCCNPAHLEPVTAHVNTLRRPDVNKSHCIHGHELTEDNLIVRERRDGYSMRNCRTCAQNQRKARPQYSPNVLADGDERHGTTTGYNYFKCRCAPCRSAFAAYMREYRKRRAS